MRPFCGCARAKRRWLRSRRSRKVKILGPEATRPPVAHAEPRLLAGASQRSQQRLLCWLKEEGGRNAALPHLFGCGDHAMAALREALSAQQEVEELANEHGGNAGAPLRELREALRRLRDLDLEAAAGLTGMDHQREEARVLMQGQAHHLISAPEGRGMHLLSDFMSMKVFRATSQSISKEYLNILKRLKAKQSERTWSSFGP